MVIIAKFSGLAVSEFDDENSFIEEGEFISDNLDFSFGRRIYLNGS